MNVHDKKTIGQFLWQRRKWKVIVGRRYENHIANILEKQGWSVHRNYLYNLQDHGIDLIAYREKTARFIQCKARRKGSLVHVNTVYQLYGAVAASADTSAHDSIVEAYIYTSTGLDPNAMDKASKLGIHTAVVKFPAIRRKLH